MLDIRPVALQGGDELLDSDGGEVEGAVSGATLGLLGVIPFVPNLLSGVHGAFLSEG